MVQQWGMTRTFLKQAQLIISTWVPLVVLILGCIPFVFITDLYSDNGNPLRKEIK